MFYKHQYFQIDGEAKRTFDENGKELRLTGNAYRMLVFLCERKNVNLTEIGEELDRAKDYNEDHLRQYRYKINTIIGHDIIEYKNGMYSMVGEVEKTEKLDLNNRNTDLLRSDSVDFWIKMKNKIKFSKNPAIIASVMLLLSFFAWPYAYYTLLRWAVTIIAIYYAWYLFVEKQCLQEQADINNFWFWTLVGVAILFNPIAPIHLGDKTIWNIIDVITAGFFIGLIVKVKK